MVGLAGKTGFTVPIKLLPGSPGINVATKLQNVVRGTCGDPRPAPAPGGSPMVAPERHPANGPITLTPFHSLRGTVAVGDDVDGLNWGANAGWKSHQMVLVGLCTGHHRVVGQDIHAGPH